MKLQLLTVRVACPLKIAPPPVLLLKSLYPGVMAAKLYSNVQLFTVIAPPALAIAPPCPSKAAFSTKRQLFTVTVPELFSIVAPEPKLALPFVKVRELRTMVALLTVKMFDR